MTHFLAIVLISPDETSPQSKIEELIAPYYTWCEVRPYREYFPEVTIRAWAEKFQTGDDLVALLEHVRASPGPFREAMLDEKGMYYITSVNPRGRWDNWCYSGGEHMLGEQQWTECLTKHNAKPGRDEPLTCNSCLVETLPEDFYPAAIVTPDGIWYDLIDFGWRAVDDDSENNRVAFANWQNKAHWLLQSHKNYLAIGLDCHW